jgi:hypothetical protein
VGSISTGFSKRSIRYILQKAPSFTEGRVGLSMTVSWCAIFTIE